jgi:thiol:disulfide interchange protein DsbD
MPCVLPVIALKILGFVNQAKESPRRVAVLGATYCAGVLVSFLVLAGLVIAAKVAGHQASWGMQFQNPVFLVAMTILVTLVALNLFGLFEVNLAGSVSGAAGELASRDGLPGAFFNGVLATALATPCTAPFLAPALGFAFAQPPAIVLAVFLTVGLGLAFPYLLLSLKPGWLKFLPKPGVWMLRFKVIMGFPMLATAIWMLTLSAPHLGKSGLLWFGFFLVVLGLGAWIWGEFVQRGTRSKGIAMAATVFLVGGFGTYVLLRASDQIEWKPWSESAVAKARSEGHPVFVDFTADWCATCQSHKRTGIEVPSVRAKLKEIGAVTLIGDYTRQDDAITQELKRFSRAGVPLELVYPKDPKQPPIVLPEVFVLTPGTVLEALDQAAGANNGKLSSAK